MEEQYFCVARGKGGRWEGLCLDLDLAVQGRSFDEVRALLTEAIASYVEDASAEMEPARSRLLTRRAPFRIRLLWALAFFRAALFGRKPDGDSPVWLPVTCRA